MKIDELKNEIDGMAMELENKDKEIARLTKGWRKEFERANNLERRLNEGVDENAVNLLRAERNDLRAKLKEVRGERDNYYREKEREKNNCIELERRLNNQKDYITELQSKVEEAERKAQSRIPVIENLIEERKHAETKLEFMKAERDALKDKNDDLLEENKAMWFDLMRLARETALYSGNEVGARNAVEEAIKVFAKLDNETSAPLQSKCESYLETIRDLGGWIATLTHANEELSERNLKLLGQVNELNSTSGDQEIKTAARVIRAALNLELNVESRGSSFKPTKYVIEGTGDTILAKFLIDAIRSLNRESKAL